MKIIGIDSSGLVASVALLEDRVLKAEYTTNFKKTHSQTLLPMLDEILSMTETEPEEVDAIAVAGGPGSFTGLRIGAATAKGLGLALDKPIIPVPTLLGLAYNYYPADSFLCPMMDARRNQVYTGIYTFAGGTIGNPIPDCAVDVTEWLLQIRQFYENSPKEEWKPLVFLGDGVPVYEETIVKSIWSEISYSFAPAHMNGQRAGSVAACGMQLYAQGKYESADVHRPNYLRLSQAERERMGRQQA